MTPPLPLIVLFLIAGFLGACSIHLPSIYETNDRAPDQHVDVTKIPNAIPKHEHKSRYGNPNSYVVFGKRYYVMSSAEGFTEQGIASWYGNKFHGRKTSSGERYDMFAMTAAHKNLPLPSYVEVTNLDNQRKVVVKVNDRGPFHEGRIIDLSYVAAVKLGITAKGTGHVSIRVVKPGYLTQSNRRLTQSKPIPTTALTTKEITNTPHEFFIQAGAFRQKDNALRLQLKLQKMINEPISITPFVTVTNTLYRVQIGPLLRADIADDISLKLEQNGIVNLTTMLK